MRGVSRIRKNLYRSLILAATFIAAVVVGSSGVAWAGCTLSGSVATWIRNGDGNWNFNANWNAPGFPNSTTESACIIDGTSAVTIQTANIQADNLQLGGGNSLALTNGTSNSRSLTINGTQIINAGTIEISSTSGNLNANLTLHNDVVLSGGGKIVFSESDPNIGSGTGLAQILANVANTTFENQDNLIEGEGRIDSGTNLTFINDAAGTVDADVSGGQLVLSSGTVSNYGLFEATNGGTLSIANGFTNKGHMATSGGGSINVSAPFTNQGQVTVGQGTLFAGSTTYSNDGSTTADGTVTVHTMTNASGGSLEGDGSITAILMNYGTVKPGDGSAVGTLTLHGDYTQELSGTLQIDIAGASTGQYSQLMDAGTSTLAGQLAIDLVNGFKFTNGETFDIFNAHVFVGDFSSVSFDNVTCAADGTDVWSCGNGLYLTESFQALAGVGPNPPNDKLLLQVREVPEPESLLLLCSALGFLGTGMAFRRRRATLHL